MAPRASLLAVVLSAAVLSAAPSLVAQPQTYTQSLAAMRSQLSDAGVDGRFAERFSGSYVFAPQRADWPQLTVANPASIGALAVGPPVRVRGQVDNWGKLTVAAYVLSRPQLQLDWANVNQAVKPLATFMEGVVGRPVGTMSADERALTLPKDKAEAEAGIKRIVDGYRAALKQGNDVERKRFVDAWAQWRAAFVDAFSDSQEAKAIYGALDNYEHWRYDIIYRQAPAVVALSEPGQSRSRCSGVLIAEDLVLTAAHCFSGEPKKKPSELEVWIGYFTTGTPGKIAAFTRRKITQLVAPPPSEVNAMMEGHFDSKLLDYAIVRIGPPDDPKLPKPDPQCLRASDMHRGEAVYVLGYPQGAPVMVHDSARIYLPHRIQDGDAFLRLRLDVEADVSRMGNSADAMLQFDASYHPFTDADGINMRELRHVRDAGQPRIGIVADTFKGNSGGPVFEHERRQCVAGILIGGSKDNGLRRTPNWKEHERVLPIAIVFEDLLRRKLDAIHDQLKIQ